MAETHPPPPPTETALDAAARLLAAIDRRMARETARELANLTAWAGVLDALGWHVALRLPGGPPLLGNKARDRADGQPGSWEHISAHLAVTPPAKWLVKSEHALVWAEDEAESSSGLPSVVPTPREAEVLSWLREGKTGPEIAIILGCARRTVESHIARLYRKLGVHHRAELMFRAGTHSSQ